MASGRRSRRAAARSSTRSAVAARVTEAQQLQEMYANIGKHYKLNWEMEEQAVVAAVGAAKKKPQKQEHGEGNRQSQQTTEAAPPQAKLREAAAPSERVPDVGAKPGAPAGKEGAPEPTTACELPGTWLPRKAKC